MGWDLRDDYAERCIIEHLNSSRAAEHEMVRGRSIVDGTIFHHGTLERVNDREVLNFGGIFLKVHTSIKRENF